MATPKPRINLKLLHGSKDGKVDIKEVEVLIGALFDGVLVVLSDHLKLGIPQIAHLIAEIANHTVLVAEEHSKDETLKAMFNGIEIKPTDHA